MLSIAVATELVSITPQSLICAARCVRRTANEDLDHKRILEDLILVSSVVRGHERELDRNDIGTTAVLGDLPSVRNIINVQTGGELHFSVDIVLTV
jgi:hypothetical protein